MNFNNANFPTAAFPNPGGCGTTNAPYYNTYSPAFACPGENQGVNSVGAASQPMIFGLTTPTGSWFIPSSSVTRFVSFFETDGPCADLIVEGLPDGATLIDAAEFGSNTQADVVACVAQHRQFVGTLLITPSNADVTQINGQQTLPAICNACFNAPVIATCVGSCANQLVASNISFGAGTSFVLIVPAGTDLTVQICAGCQVETPAFTSCGIPQTAQAQAPVASYCPPIGSANRQF